MEMAGKVCFFGKNSLEMSKQFGCKLHPDRTMCALRSIGFWMHIIMGKTSGKGSIARFLTILETNANY